MGWLLLALGMASAETSGVFIEAALVEQCGESDGAGPAVADGGGWTPHLVAQASLRAGAVVLEVAEVLVEPGVQAEVAEQRSTYGYSLKVVPVPRSSGTELELDLVLELHDHESNSMTQLAFQADVLSGEMVRFADLPNHLSECPAVALYVQSTLVPGERELDALRRERAGAVERHFAGLGTRGQRRAARRLLERSETTSVLR